MQTANLSDKPLSNFGSANWICQIPGFDDLVLKITKFTIPEVNAGVTAIGNRTGFILQTSGDHIQFENLTLDFILDENLKNYINLYKRMRKNIHYGIEESTSVFVHFIGNDKRFQGIEIEFRDAFPISLSGIDLDSDGDTTDVTCTATFAYTGFDFLGMTDLDDDYSQ